jgi:hypothetical protein
MQRNATPPQHCPHWLSSSPCLMSKPVCHEVELQCKPPRRQPDLCSPTAACPRCDANSKLPHVCPMPTHLAAVATLFERTLVLCHGKGCSRHLGDYWPASMSVEAFDAQDLDRRLARGHGPAVAALLGLDGEDAGRPAVAAQRAARTLLAHFELVRVAAERRLSSVLILEDDVRPLGALSMLHRHEVEALRTRLLQPWSVVRAGGLYRSFQPWYRKEPGSCTPACRCVAIKGVASRLCEVRAPPASANGTLLAKADFCEVRDTIAYAVSASAYPTFLRARETALAALRQASQAPERGNASFGLPLDAFGAPLGLPWVDIWLPAALDGERGHRTPPHARAATLHNHHC